MRNCSPRWQHTTTEQLRSSLPSQPLPRVVRPDDRIDLLEDDEKAAAVRCSDEIDYAPHRRARRVHGGDVGGVVLAWSKAGFPPAVSKRSPLRGAVSIQIRYPASGKGNADVLNQEYQRLHPHPTVSPAPQRKPASPAESPNIRVVLLDQALSDRFPVFKNAVSFTINTPSVAPGDLTTEDR